jgi:hypothetical protein
MEEIMKLRFQIICCLWALFISGIAKAMWPDVRFAVEATTEGKRPVCLKVPTGERINNRREYFAMFGDPGQLPANKDQLETERKRFHSLYAADSTHFYRQEKMIAHEIVLSCIEGNSPAYLFESMKAYLELLLASDDKVFRNFSVSHFVDGVLWFSFRRLGIFREECGWSNECLFLSVLAETFDKLKNKTIEICPLGASWDFLERLNQPFL